MRPRTPRRARLALAATAAAAAMAGLPGPVPAQSGPTPFATMMSLATVRSVVEVDTAAGRTAVLMASAVPAPRLAFVFAPGGEGTVDFTAGADGSPVSARPRNPAFTFSLEFLKREAGWAIVAVPERYGAAIDLRQRLEADHVEAVAQAGRRIREAWPKAKLVLIGHSNGGVTAGMQATQPVPAFDAVVMSAPALGSLPNGWQPAQARVPLMFITHKHDNCRNTMAYRTILMAGDRHPVKVIEKPSAGPWTECRTPPAPHFYTDVLAEYAEAILAWAGALPAR